MLDTGPVPSAPSLDPLAPVTLVVGPEELLASRAIAATVAGIRLADPGTQVHRLRATGLEVGAISALAAPSLFGGHVAIVVEEVGEAAAGIVDELRGLIAQPADEVHLVLVHSGGARGRPLLDAARASGAPEVPCPAVKSDRDKIAFVEAEFRRAHRSVTPGAARALVDALGANVRELAAACSQLVADCEGRVDDTAVERYHRGRVEASGFDVADAALTGQAERALLLLRHALAVGVAPVLVTSALASGLRTLAKVGSARGGTKSVDLARELALPPFLVDKARRQLPGWTPGGIAAAITVVATADAEVKGAGAGGDPAYALERTVLAVASARSTSPPR